MSEHKCLWLYKFKDSSLDITRNGRQTEHKGENC